MPGSKRKNGKEGRVVAEVTKNAPKFTKDRESPKDSPKDSPKGSLNPTPPPLDSPDLRPIIPSSNGPPATSPLLDAVSTTSFATSPSPNMRDWAKGGPAGMAGSPGNLISLMGESPPTQPSSYDESRMPSGWSSPRPSANYHAFGASPPTAPATTRSIGRPLSNQFESHFSPPGVHSAARTPAAAARRSSMHSPFAQARGSPNPPLPHLPQPHFYGATGLDHFDLEPRAGLKPGERGYYFGFDTLPCLNVDHTPGKDNVVLAGYEGGLEVYAVGKRGVDHVVSLKGLRGGVYCAKILPWTAQDVDLFPLVAVVVHGPAFPLPSPGIQVEGEDDGIRADRPDTSLNTNLDAGARDGRSGRPTPGFIEAYQTTVEVYSLKTNKLVQVLLEAPKDPLKTSITSELFKPPPPSGGFNIKADGCHIVVSSGDTGECWVFRQMIVPSSQQRTSFVCLGKVWTTLQHSQKEDASAPRIPQPLQQPSSRPVAAVVSLTGRWMAFCPAAPQSPISLRASVPVPVYGRAPGLTSLTSPHLPPVNAEVDLANAESVMNKIMRDATQELIQGAKWVGKQGLSAWNKYWYSPPQQPTLSPPQGQQGWGVARGAQPDSTQFPPTHGATAAPTLPKEPGLISIVDLDTLGNSSSLHPVATFQIPQGCSFLSMAPSGLLLFTASSKGDVQTVWDLMRIHHTRSSNLQPSTIVAAGSPRVRQVAQFSRMTYARVVDVAWMKPNGERAAMVTERGTVHLFDLPSSALTWPPARRRTKEEKGQGGDGDTAASAAAMASNALNSVRQAAGPLLSRHRRSNSNAPPQTGSALVDHAAHGGKVIVAGISHSLGMTSNALNQLRHTGENRVSLPGSVSSPGPSCVVWVPGRKSTRLFVLGDGLVRTFPAKRHRAGSTTRKNRTGRLTRYTDFKLQPLPDDKLSLRVRAFLDPEEYLDLAEKVLDASNDVMVFNNRPMSRRRHSLAAGSAIPQAEIESSAPYQPFHTDRRVALYETGVDSGADGHGTSLSVLLANTTLDDKPTTSSSKRKQRQQQAGNQKLTDAWVFGQPIDATKIDLGLPALSEEESLNITSGDLRALPPSAMETVYRVDGDTTQIVVTTRRRRGAGRGADAGDDGFFEDDCEVLDFADQRV